MKRFRTIAGLWTATFGFFTVGAVLVAAGAPLSRAEAAERPTLEGALTLFYDICVAQAPYASAQFEALFAARNGRKAQSFGDGAAIWRARSVDGHEHMLLVLPELTSSDDPSLRGSRCAVHLPGVPAEALERMAEALAQGRQEEIAKQAADGGPALSASDVAIVAPTTEEAGRGVARVFYFTWDLPGERVERSFGVEGGDAQEVMLGTEMLRYAIE